MTDDTPRATTALNTNAYTGLFQAVGGLRNGRAFAAMTGCAVVGVVVSSLLLSVPGLPVVIASMLGVVVWLLAFGTGVNAAGLLHMDTARGISRRSVVDALVQGLMCIPKLLVLAVAVLAVEIAVFLLIAVLLFLCKIPLLGPVLYTVVFPVSVVVAGITVFSLFLGATLSVPAIWQGATIPRALAQTFAILRSRLVEAVLLLLVVGALSFAVGAVVFGVLGAGMVTTLGLSTSILGFAGTVASPGMGLPIGFGGGGYGVAGTIGGLVLWAVAVSLVAQVYLLGLCIVYLRVTEGLDLTAAEATLRGKLDEARRRTSELGEKAKAAARTDAPTPTASTAPVMPVAAASMSGVVGAAQSPAASSARVAAPWSDEVTVAPMPAAPAPVEFDPTVPAVLTTHPAPAADIDIPFGSSTQPGPLAPMPPVASSPAIAPPSPFEPPAAVVNCPQCMAAITPDDVFCGVCGYRLK